MNAQLCATRTEKYEEIIETCINFLYFLHRKKRGRPYVLKVRKKKRKKNNDFFYNIVDDLNFFASLVNDIEN